MTFDRIIVAAPGIAGADGASELARQWIEALASSGGGAAIEVWSLTDEARPAALPDTIGFRTAAGSRWRFGRIAIGAGAMNARTLVVVMHVHLLPALLPLFWRGACGVAVMLGIEVWKPLRMFERIALGRAWRVVAISAHTAARFRQVNPALADLPVLVCHPRVPCPVTPGAAQPMPRYALIVGRMSAAERYKGHDLLIDIWPRVLAAAPDATLVIAGAGDDAERLRGRVAAAGLGDRIHFLGAVTAQRLAALYRDATCFVMPSAGEGFGLVFLEAMRAGTPCIAPPGAAEEIMTSGADGIIVDPSRADDVAAAVITLFLDAPYRNQLGAAAAETVTQRFNAGHLHARIRAILTGEC